jgi:probable rRNA maturation factor
VNVLDVDVVKAVRAEVTPAFVRRVLARAAAVPEIAARLPEGRSTVALRITDDDEIRRLNRDFAGEDHSTDVLSFQGSGDHVGDIAISWPAVVEQAPRYGNDTRTELAFLCIHGLLHLLGWDHRTRAEAQEMWRLSVVALRLSRLVSGPRRIARWSGYTPIRGLRRSPRA